MMVAVVFLHKLPQRDGHGSLFYLCKNLFIGLQELFKDLLEGDDSNSLLPSADIVYSTERATPI